MATARSIPWARVGHNALGSIALAVLLTALLSGLLGITDLRYVAVLGGFNLVVTLAIGGIIDLAYTLLLSRLAVDDRPLAWRLTFHAVVVGIAVLGGVEIAFRVAEPFVSSIAQMLPRTGVVRVAVPVTIAMVAIGRERERMRRRAAEAELQGEQLQRHALRTELAALQSRTNPHFLFNALNTIAALIAEDPARAERAVEMLAGLLRYALEGTRHERVPLREELAAVEQYVELERLRFSDRLAVDITVDPALLDELLPPMLLQPLVENAVRHAVAQRRGTTTVRVDVARVEARVAISVSDDGPGTSGHHGTGTALADLRARMALLYGDGAQVEAGPVETGFRVRLMLPVGGPCAS